MANSIARPVFPVNSPTTLCSPSASTIRISPLRSRMVFRFHPGVLSRVSLLLAWVAFASVHLCSQAAPAAQPAHTFFRVQVAATVGAPVSGRLLVFLKAGTGDKEVSISEFHPADTWVAAREVRDLAPGATVEFDADEIAYPKPFSALPAGIYEAQAVLDV